MQTNKRLHCFTHTHTHRHTLERAAQALVLLLYSDHMCADDKEKVVGNSY